MKNKRDLPIVQATPGQWKHKAKKSLGQNFLKSELALREIIKAGNIKEDDTILEIGPGKGALTKKLLEKSNNVIAVEKDEELYEFLKEKFSKEISEKRLTLSKEDILEFEIKKYKIKNYKIIANIPYNITGAILKQFLTEKTKPTMMVLMVQHEVAKRILAKDKKESILSISVKTYGKPKMILKVPARYFSPAPKVDSAVIQISDISNELFDKNMINEEKFWEMIHLGFAHKRKRLKNNLKKIINLPEEKWGNLRAEELSIDDWIDIYKKSFNS